MKQCNSECVTLLCFKAKFVNVFLVFSSPTSNLYSFEMLMMECCNFTQICMLNCVSMLLMQLIFLITADNSYRLRRLSNTSFPLKISKR